jgi:D-tyrosyl-tRNA(Tyr) deacylase
MGGEENDESTGSKDDTSSLAVQRCLDNRQEHGRGLSMMALLQRVGQARVTINGVMAGDIGAGLLVLLCAERGDTCVEADKLLTKILKLRIFSDAAGKMNYSVQDMDGQGGMSSSGGLLVVSQFTLAADVSGGNRPSFTAAAAPDEGRRLYDHFVAQARLLHPIVQTGQFGADMQVSLVNDGPVTVSLRVQP